MIPTTKPMTMSYACPRGEFEARQDPLYELDKSRAKAVFKLKSRFESIFDKYERDFDGEGDEVNLHTGEVIINNGHLQSLEDEQDKEDLSADEEEEERILQGKNPPSTSTSFNSGQSTSYNAASPLQNNWAHPPMPNADLPSFSGLSITPAQHYGMLHPFAAFAPAPVDPMWQTPELQMSGHQGHFGLFGNAYNGQMNPFQGFGYGGSIGRTLNRRAPRRIATAKELAVRNRQDAFLGEELAEDEGNGGFQSHGDEGEDEGEGEGEGESALPGVAKEHGRPEQRSSEPTKQGSQKRDSVPSATTSKTHFPRSDSIIKKGRPTTVDAVQSGSHTSPGVSDKIWVGDVTSTKSPDCQAQHKEHSVAPTNEVVQSAGKTDNPHIPEQSSSFVIELQSAPGGVIPPKQLVAKRIRKEEESLQEVSDTAEGSQSRRSGRPRAKPEFYGDVSWLKTRRPKPDLEAILDPNPNEDDDMRPEATGDELDVETAMLDAPNDTEFLAEETAWENPEDLQPGDIGNKAFIEAAESIFLSRSNHVTESPEWAREPTPNRLSELQPEETVGSERAHPIQQAESFSRNQIDPSYDFSDDNDMFQDPESPKLPGEVEPGIRKSPETESEGLDLSNGATGHAIIPEAEGSSNTPTNLDEEVSAVESLSTATTVETTELSRKPSLSEINIGEATHVVLEEAGEEKNARAASPEILVDRTAIAAGELASRKASPEEHEHDSSGPTGSSEPRERVSSPPLGSELSPSLSRAKAKPKRPQPDSAASPRTPTKKAKTKRTLDNERGEQSTKQQTATSSATNRLTASAKKHALASLIPDNSDDEDEISILAHTPTSSRHADAAPPSSSPLGSNAVEPFTPSSHRARSNRRRSLGGGSAAAVRQSGSRHAPATDAARRRSKAGHRAAAAAATAATRTTAVSSPLLQRVLKTPRTARRYHNPSCMEEEGLVRTPGGTMRRCGVDGFVCDRDFCLTCCK
ncbi:centromere protein Scm3 [Apiospora marii]|uniref:centromere protein Scm3 n=1 Tax=Apiospora marii TaxID=335849 RepID=UPI0031315AA8